MLSITWIIVGFFVIRIDKVKGQLLEMSGFHCKQQNSMLLDHSLHGSPHLTTPPFEFYVIDEDGNEVNMYEPGKIYRIRLIGYIHFRGFMIQSRLATPEGYLIGSLRGGRFIIEDKGDVFGVRYQDCDDSQSNNSLTHSNNAKKFLLEIGWTTDHDIGAVQFLLTVAVENELYWERWRPRNGFLRSSSVPQVPIIESLFEIQVPPGPEEPTLSPDQMASTLPPEELTTVEPFDSRILEEIEKAEEKAVKHLHPKERLIALNSAANSLETSSLEIMTSESIPISTSTSTTSSTSTSILTSTSTSTSDSTSTSTSTSTTTTTSTPTTLSTTISIGLSRRKNKGASRFQHALPIFTPPENTTKLTTNEVNTNGMSRVRFKNFSTSNNNVRLSDDDLRFLNSHTQRRQRDFIDTKMDPEETCRHSNPCENNGICVVEKQQIRCDCPIGFTGPHCEEIDMCINNACAHNSICKNGPKNTYICQCRRNTVGTYCQFTCKEDECSGNGECILKENNEIGCRCNPGFSGLRCEKEENECQLNKCLNSIECIDKFNDYECICEDGWIGKDCNRPCQDVYGSCKFWKREGQCEISPEDSDFFQLNCPVACEKCKPSNDTKKIDRLPAVLLPLSWILGEWNTKVKGFSRIAFDFPLDFKSSGFNETLTFSVAKPLMFGTPSINYTCIAVSYDDPYDIHMHSGFLTIRQYPPKNETTSKVALMSVNNQGTIIIEEGPMNTVEFVSGPILSLISTYTKSYGNLNSIMPTKTSRSFMRKESQLIQTITKEINGKTIKFKKIYKQTRKFEFL